MKAFFRFYTKTDIYLLSRDHSSEASRKSILELQVSTPSSAHFLAAGVVTSVHSADFSAGRRNICFFLRNLY